MISPELTKKLDKQYAVFGEYIDRYMGEPEYANVRKKAVHFLRNIYGQWFVDVTSESAEENDEEALIVLRASLYPEAMQSGFHRKTLLYAAPNTKVGQLMSEILVSGPGGQSILISGEEVEAFRNLCTATVSCNEDGTGCILTVSCRLKDRMTGEIHELSRVVDLEPAIQWGKREIMKYHDRLHADSAAHSEDKISGLFDGVATAITNMANNKATKDLATAALPLLAMSVPGGPAMLQIAATANQTVQNAKAGDPASTAHIQAVQDAANAGDQQAMKMAILMKTLSIMQDDKATKPAPAPAKLSLGAMALGAHYNNHGHKRHHKPNRNVAQARDPRAVARGRAAIEARRQKKLDDMQAKIDRQQAAQDYQDQMDDLKSQSDAMKQGYGGGGGGGDSGGGGGSYDDQGQTDPGYDDTMYYPPGPLSPPLIDPFSQAGAGVMGPIPQDVYDPSVYDQDDTYDPYAVSGWAYNRPYRTPAQAILDGSPGVGLTLRSLYSNGVQALVDRARAKIAAGK
jgi:uncharacterized membrane protein YgcG